MVTSAVIISITSLLPGQSGLSGRADVQQPLEIPFEIGKTYYYDYYAGGQEIGYNSFRLEKEEDRIRLLMETTIQQNESKSVLTTDEAAHPLHYSWEFTFSGRSGMLEASFEEGKVVVYAEPIDREPVELESEVGTDIYFFNNNSLPHWALFMPFLGLEPGESRTAKVFHPQLVRVFDLTFEAGEMEEIEWRETTVKAMPVGVNLAGNRLTFWLDEAHRLLRDEEGNLRIDLRKQY